MEKLSLELADQVAGLILATKHIHTPRTREAQVLLDVDLSILGTDPKVFDQYEVNIRKEYGWVEESAFRKGRRGVLEGFLSRPRIYATPEFQNSSYEPRARANLIRSIAHLSG